MTLSGIIAIVLFLLVAAFWFWRRFVHTASDNHGGGHGNPPPAVDPLSVVGRWETTGPEGGKFWWQFEAGGACAMYDDSGFTRRHLAGTWNQSANSLKALFTNPGVGQGELRGTVAPDGRTMKLDFIEYWHSPAKNVPYQGRRL
jgi:hypothetical protein